MDKTCWTCGHWLLGLGCTKSGINNYVDTSPNHSCDAWLPEGTKGTETDFSEINDGDKYADNEYLKDNLSNL